MKINGRVLYQLFKYSIYTLLTINIFVFFGEEWLAARLEFPQGVPLGQVFKAYAATIDTAAWVILLLMFELETYVLDEQQFTPLVQWTLHGLRALCYAFIVYAFFGYVANLMFHYDTRVLDGVTDICTLQSGAWSWTVTLDEYAKITAANCAQFVHQLPLYTFNDVPAVVDRDVLVEIRRLAWVDVINSAVWLLVVLVLEIDVRLQEQGRLQGLALTASNAIKFVLYSVLLLAAIYWGVKGDFVDFWDAFLWLVAFVFIELNIFEWRHEDEWQSTT